MVEDIKEFGPTELSYRSLLSDPRLLTMMSINGVGIASVEAISPALSIIGQGLAVPDAQIGLVMSAFFLPAVVAVPLFGVLSDIYGRRTIVLPMLLVTSVSGFATLFVTTLGQLLAVRVIQGIAFAGMTPLTITLIGDIYSGSEGAAAQGLRDSVGGLSTMVAPAISGILVAFAWQYPFLLYLLALPVFALAYVYLPEPITGQTTAAPSLLGTVREYSEAISHEFRDRNVFLLILGAFLIFFIRFAIITIVPLYAIRDLGTTAALAGLVLSIRGGVRIIVAPLSGAVVERLSVKTAIVICVLVVALGSLLNIFSSNFIGLALAVGVYSIGVMLVQPMVNNAVADLASAERRGGVVGAMNAFKNASNTISPAIFGFVFAVSDSAVVFTITTLIALGYAGVFLVFFRR